MNITKIGGFCRNLKISMRKRRRGLSELMGTLIMVTITLIAGAAVFGWINGQANSSETAYGVSVANNINFLHERFVVVTQSFSASPPQNPSIACSTVGGANPHYYCTLLTFWVYNSGQVGFNLYSVRIQNLSDIPNGFGICATSGGCPLNVLFFPASSSACSSNPQTCGFVVFNKAGTSQICYDAAAFTTAGSIYQPGFYQNGLPPTTLAQGLLTPNPYEITMPTASTCPGGGAQYLYDGLAYTLTFTGLYGNSLSTTVTVNG
jgi:flagellin-like protein